MSWVLADLFIKDDELIISGKFSIPFDEIKHVSTKIVDENEIVVLTLKDKAIEFKTYNAHALKTAIDERREIMVNLDNDNISHSKAFKAFKK